MAAKLRPVDAAKAEPYILLVSPAPKSHLKESAMKGVEERAAAAMKVDRRADLDAALLDNVTKRAAIKQLNIKAGDNISYTDFLEWKSKDLIDDN